MVSVVKLGLAMQLTRWGMNWSMSRLPLTLKHSKAAVWEASLTCGGQRNTRPCVRMYYAHSYIGSFSKHVMGKGAQAWVCVCVSHFCSCIISALETFSGVGLHALKAALLILHSGASVSAAEPIAAEPLATVEPCEGLPFMKNMASTQKQLVKMPMQGLWTFSVLKASGSERF